MQQNTTEQNIFLTMGTIFHDARKHCDELFKPYDLSRNEWLTLAILRVNASKVSQKFVLSSLGMESSYFSKMLNSLEDKGFIRRAIDRNDRRNRIISLNPAKKAITTKIFDVLHDLNQAIQQDLSQIQRDELYNTLALITNSLKSIINKK